MLRWNCFGKGQIVFGENHETGQNRKRVLPQHLLDKQIAAPRDLDGNSPAVIARPDVQARVPRTSVDSQEVEVGVEAGEDSVDLAVSTEITRCWGEKMWPAHSNQTVRSQSVAGWSLTHTRLPA